MLGALTYLEDVESSGCGAFYFCESTDSSDGVRDFKKCKI